MDPAAANLNPQNFPGDALRLANVLFRLIKRDACRRSHAGEQQNCSNYSEDHTEILMRHRTWES